MVSQYRTSPPAVVSHAVGHLQVVISSWRWHQPVAVAEWGGGGRSDTTIIRGAGIGTSFDQYEARPVCRAIDIPWQAAGQQAVILTITLCGAA